MTDLSKATAIIEDSANALWAVWPTNGADLAHLWFGFQVKRVGGSFAPKAKARTMLIRRECTKIIAKLN